MVVEISENLLLAGSWARVKLVNYELASELWARNNVLRIVLADRWKKEWKNSWRWEKHEWWCLSISKNEWSSEHSYHCWHSEILCFMHRWRNERDVMMDSQIMQIPTCYQFSCGCSRKLFDARQKRVSTGERPFIDILQDRRYWVIHVITIPSLFIAGAILVVSGFVFKIFSSPTFNQYFSVLANGNTQISLINDRFSVLSELQDA